MRIELNVSRYRIDGCIMEGRLSENYSHIG